MTTDRRIKIALITDVNNWAFGNVARQFKKHLSDYFDFTMISLEECDWNGTKLLFRVKDCDILHFFWRDCIALINEDSYKAYFGPLPISATQFLKEYYLDKILSTAVYDHLFLKSDEIIERKSIFDRFHYYVSSEKLYDIYSEISEYPNPVSIVEDGVDPGLFYPVHIERLKDTKRSLKIGWVGNSKWGQNLGEDFKGFQSILKPVMDELVLETDGGIIGFFADKNERFITHEEMVNYYSEIDILVCVSKIEGTPNPILEAMACGVPVISTDVGIVNQVFGEKQKQFILSERDSIELKKAIYRIFENRSILEDLSKENLDQIKHWNWSKKAFKFKNYIDTIVSNKIKQTERIY
ncbi:glycosyltransferase [Paenibacillus hunanensis]|uniref:glycosyltransferase n=1 Tax=Paenibacillus hunanensis TaxID=539262 RepID=UPI002025B832|nr:glycosyltransferase [Paenibacillus hunanensis]MCL9662827.1 glycosyltransferase [Paenibacillus hunanensis]